jgi:hypothetical protein
MKQARHGSPALGESLLGDAYADALLAWLRRLLAWRVDVTREVYGPAARAEAMAYTRRSWRRCDPISVL